MIGIFEMAEINSLNFYVLFGGVEKENNLYYLRIKDSNGEIYWEKEFKTDLALARYLYFSSMPCNNNNRFFKNLFNLIRTYLNYLYGDVFRKDTKEILIYNIKTILTDLDKDLHTTNKIEYYLTNLKGKTMEGLKEYIKQVYPEIQSEASKG